jgi:hypothetical protein
LNRMQDLPRLAVRLEIGQSKRHVGGSGRSGPRCLIREEPSPSHPVGQRKPAQMRLASQRCILDRGRFLRTPSPWVPSSPPRPLHLQGRLFCTACDTRHSKQKTLSGLRILLDALPPHRHTSCAAKTLA